jgi:hypothetical protein
MRIIVEAARGRRNLHHLQQLEGALPRLSPLTARTVPSPGDCYGNGHVWMSPRGALALYPDGHVLTAETTLVVQFTSLLDRSSGLVLSSAMSFGTSQL